jgi:DeoR/GlpR family transcriptional regulator of sugar metabolism
MLSEQRRLKILELLQEEGSARVSTLSKLFKVSEPTVRQDLEKLEEEGLVLKEHGGASLKSISQQVKSLSLQHLENLDKKMLIARKAAEYVNNGDSVILDSGSTVTELAKNLTGRQGLKVITNALNIALNLGANGSCEVLMTGGEFKAPTLSLTGERAADFFREIHVDKLFLATGGISSALNLTYPGFADLPVKRAMIEAAEHVYLVADSTKIGKSAFASLGAIDMVHTFITDSGLSPKLRAEIERRGVEVIVCEE